VRTQLQERHRALFSSLDHNQTTLVWDRVSKAYSTEFSKVGWPPPSNGGEVFEICREAGLDHARVVLSLARESDNFGRGTIEALIGRPIVPWAESVEAANGAGLSYVVSKPQTKREDTRVVVSVIPNPHKKIGSQMQVDYAYWRVGDTVQECRDRGLSARSVRRDVRHGHVVLGAPR